MIDALPLLLGPEGYQISRSVRLRLSASAYFNRTPGSVTNRKTMTFSFWMKRGLLTYSSNYITLFSAYPGTSAIDQIAFSPSSDSLRVWFNGSASADLITTQVFRDPSAWYHIVVAIDTTQATASNRIKVYANGSQITSFSTATYPALNYDTYWNSSSYASAIGANLNGPQGYFDGYLTEVNFIDGQALTPSSFGETDAVTGVWKPKKYTGTYGTNGFYLNFSDNSAATAAAIGKDNSGNGNNWTPNNISVTAGVTYDSMLDVPTQWADGGNGRGNYAVVNPLSKGTSQTSVIDGNLYAIPISGASNWGTVFSSIAIPTSGKWYMEATAQVYAGSGNSSSFGVVDSTTFIPTNTATLYTFTAGEGFDGILAHLFSDYVSPISDGVQGTNVTGLTGTSINLMLALDVDNGKVYAGYNGTWLNSGNPAGGTGEVASRTFSANDVVAGHTSWNGTNDQSQYYNFGQRPFAYTPPTGFKALNTLNLPTPTILKGNQYFDIILYNGNNSASTRSITGLAFQPDLIWIKNRNGANSHRLTDSVRGSGISLISNSTSADVVSTTTAPSAFISGGFQTTTSDNSINGLTTDTYVAWQWKEGATQGFDVVTYTGNGTSQNISHSLGVAPRMMIVKKRSTTGNWPVYHASLGNATSPFLNLTNAANSQPNLWNSTTPTSSVFTVGSDAETNANTATYVAYLFAEVAGFSKFGSYTGNGSSDGVFVHLGFRARYLLIKETGNANSWEVYDTARNSANVQTQRLFPNDSLAEATTDPSLDILSNGFKCRAGNTGINRSGGTYIYAAFAENPLKFSLAR